MDVLTSKNNKEQAFDIQIHGLVQGVGFRPTVWNLARRDAIRGRVSNNEKGSRKGLSRQTLYQYDGHRRDSRKCSHCIDQGSSR